MTHDEAAELLSAYALGALDDNVQALEAHLRGCARCSGLLASYLDTTAALGEAVDVVTPPVALRSAILGRAQQPTQLKRRWQWPTSIVGRVATIAATLLVVLSVGLGAGNIAQQRQLAATRSDLALDERGLALLTSTETTVERMAPVAATASNEHGHWYHRPGIATQVVVVEFMPVPPAGDAYYGWLQRRDSSWVSVGRFTLDANGYGRVILPGTDGTDVTAVVVTRQSSASSTPTGEVVLRWPSP